FAGEGRLVVRDELLRGRRGQARNVGGRDGSIRIDRSRASRCQPGRVIGDAIATDHRHVAVLLDQVFLERAAAARGNAAVEDDAWVLADDGCRQLRQVGYLIWRDRGAAHNRATLAGELSGEDLRQALAIGGVVVNDIGAGGADRRGERDVGVYFALNVVSARKTEVRFGLARRVQEVEVDTIRFGELLLGQARVGVRRADEHDGVLVDDGNLLL